jgi:hypothetical protein
MVRPKVFLDTNICVYAANGDHTGVPLAVDDVLDDHAGRQWTPSRRPRPRDRATDGSRAAKSDQAVLIYTLTKDFEVVRETMTVSKRCIASLICTFAALVSMSAQYTNATLSGTVTDSSGAAVADAKVIIQNQDVGLRKTGNTAADGSFLFPALPIGSYKVTVEKPGFREYVQNGVVLVVSHTAHLQIGLQVGEMQQQVTISAMRRCSRPSRLRRAS